MSVSTLPPDTYGIPIYPSTLLLDKVRVEHTYEVRKDGELSWTVERDDGEEYFVNYLIFKEQFSCTCQGNVLGYNCKHIHMVKEFIVKNDSKLKDVKICP